MELRDAVTREDALAWMEAREGMRELPPFMKSSLAEMWAELELRRRLSENQLHPSTVESPAAARDLFRLAGHEMRGNQVASVNVTVTLKAEATQTGPVTIPAMDLRATTRPGPLPTRTFEAREAVTVLQGNSTFTVRLYDQETRTATILNERTTGQDQQEIELPYRDIIPETARLFIGGEEWLPVESLAGSGATDRHFVLLRDSDGRSRIVFGFTDEDGEQYGASPAPDQTITLNCATGGGTAGNVEAGEISDYAGENQDIVSVSNPARSEGGRPPESITNARRIAPMRARTHDMFWDLTSGETIASAVPGVLFASVVNEAFNRFRVSILPTGGGTASQTLIEAVHRALLDASPMEQYDIQVESAALVNQSITGRLKMLPGNAFAPARRAARLAAAVRSHEAGLDLLETFRDGGIEPALLWINTTIAPILGETFSQDADGAVITRILELMPHAQRAGDSLHPEDIRGFIMTAVRGVDLAVVTGPATTVSPGPGAYVHPTGVDFTEET